MKTKDYFIIIMLLMIYWSSVPLFRNHYDNEVYTKDTTGNVWVFFTIPHPSGGVMNCVIKSSGTTPSASTQPTCDWPK